MKSFTHEHKHLIIGFSIVGSVIVTLAAYSLIRMNMLSTRINDLSMSIVALNSNLASTTAALQSTIEQTHTSLSSALSAEQQHVGTIQQQLGGFQNQVGTLSGTLTTLQKLAQTDPELLKKYSKVYFLNENYVPDHLSEIPKSYQYSDNKQLLIQTNVLPHLEAMINDASSTGVMLYTFSAYRSFAEQRALKGEYTMTYGAGTANSFSADQGYSEHQLGTAVDMITPGLGGVLEDTFDGTKAYQWMLNNAYKYGFELSYPKNNGYYVYEPWHWRFVGIKLASYLHDNKLNFYDLDQRTIDTYLVNIWD
ncbi:MAG TPA: D-alanyl-D-alanine carboxypeptidase family protein [Candidatus Paceibacterota bacterium]|jgi:LAS superfamily LD-carboxypeptidase LdcB|nr:D-alanyl-D-alanine carboxypeptidase family protein [Candidatus Paceibacterota bacterium]